MRHTRVYNLVPRVPSLPRKSTFWGQGCQGLIPVGWLQSYFNNIHAPNAFETKTSYALIYDILWWVSISRGHYHGQGLDVISITSYL